MAISLKSVKILWSASGGRCAFDGCWERLCYQDAEGVAPFTLGEMAHICGEKPGSNRYSTCQTATERNDYTNLILLCPTHHTLIDRKENETKYTVTILHAMKARHEARVLARLDQGIIATKFDIAQAILPLLEENKQAWSCYGPHSEIARSQPYNEAAKAVWTSERLATIVPNNRKIAELLQAHQALFNSEELTIITTFLLHVRSYEKWVQDSIPYSTVKRFPVEFDRLIRGFTDASA